MVRWARNDDVIEVAEAQINRVRGRGAQSRLKSQSEQKRTKWVPLLNTARGRQNAVPEAEVGGLAVAVVSPTRNGRHMFPGLGKDGSPADGVEGISEVHLDQSAVGGGGMAPRPLPGGVNSRFAPRLNTDTHL